MGKTYCGACRGERGCSDCRLAARTITYTALTGFFGEAPAREMPDTNPAGEFCADRRAFCDRELLLAADLGTTTLAFVCADRQGAVLASYGMANPQRKVAADVIGRIDASLHGQRENLTKGIREALVQGFLFVLERGLNASEYGRAKEQPFAVRLAIAGNTTMQHLLMDYPLEGMAKAPFLPYTIEAKTVSFAELFSETSGYAKAPELLRRAEVTVFPCFSAFVGGDIAAGACALLPQGENRTCLLLDLGTNGELLLKAGGKVFGTAAAMGSAFEGGRYAYASDLFRLVAEALRQGKLDETGLLCESYFTEGFYGLQQEDVREFQLAKGALRAGLEVLCRHANVAPSEVEHIFIAGGVGRYCKMEELFCTGLLPREFAGRVQIVGNSCIGGMLSCFRAGKIMQCAKADILNLAEEPEFAELYYRYMNFENVKEA